MNKFILAAIKWFFERQLKKWGEEFDWRKFRVDAYERIAALIPGEEFDEAAKYAAGVFIDMLEAYFYSKGNVPEEAYVKAEQHAEVAFQEKRSKVK